MAISPDERFRLPLIPGVVREHARNETPADQAALDRLNYKSCYGLIVDGKVRAVRIGSGWAIYGRDLPALAAHLNLRLQDVNSSVAKSARTNRAPSNLATVEA